MPRLAGDGGGRRAGLAGDGDLGNEPRGLGQDEDAAGRGCAMLPLCHAGRVARGAQGPGVPASARGGGRC